VKGEKSTLQATPEQPKEQNAVSFVRGGKIKKKKEKSGKIEKDTPQKRSMNNKHEKYQSSSERRTAT